MAQFSVYKNLDPGSKAAYPYLLDIQSELLHDLSTRVVVPLAPASGMAGKTIKTLMPVFKLAGKNHVLLTPQLAGIARKQLGDVVADCSSQRDEIIAALDLLISGI